MKPPLRPHPRIRHLERQRVKANVVLLHAICFNAARIEMNERITVV